MNSTKTWIRKKKVPTEGNEKRKKKMKEKKQKTEDDRSSRTMKRDC
jgi:hypothetical protein